MPRELIITTRRDAHAKGWTRYFDGNACKHGHLAERFVSNAGCTQCVNFKRQPAARAPNTFMPPSPYAFAGWMKMTPGLLSAVHGRVLTALPNIVNDAERARKIYEPLQPPYRLTAKAIAEGMTREKLIEAGWNDLDLFDAGYVELGPFRNWGTVKT